MNQNDIEQIILEYSRPFADRRIHVFEIEPALDGSRLRLSGRVLEASQRQGLVEALDRRFPDLTLDASGVCVLRDSAQPRWVSTNLASLHHGTSFLTELSTQMLNGAALELLSKDEDGLWGFVRLANGYLGWTYLLYLTDQPAPKPTHFVAAPVGLLRQSPAEDAQLVTRVLGGTAVCVDQVDCKWAILHLTGGRQGWLPVSDLRALDALPSDSAGRRAQVAADGWRLIGVPYLWGGSSAHGIDCSGFAQLLHHWSGMTIPRDADMQYAAGQPVEPPFEPGDLLFFGEAGEQRRVTHVGVSLGGWRILHSSRSRNGVQVDDVQAAAGLRKSFLFAATYIGK